MKKLFVALTLILAVLSATPQEKDSVINKTDKAFFLVYNQVLELNKNQFSNLNMIQVGDTVIFPSQTGQGTEIWVADEPQNEVHDCIWILTEKYLDKKIQTTPTEIKEINNSKEINFSPIFWLFIIIFIIALFVVMLLTIKANHARKNNPDSYPPVLGDLSNENSETVIQKIGNHLSEEEKITKIERGYLIRESGTKELSVEMEFGDQKNRQVNLGSGEKVTRVTIEDDKGISHREFWREHCGNYFAIIKSGRIKVPAGWKFIEEISSPSEEPSVTAPNKEMVEELKTAPATSILQDGQQITILIEEEDKGTKIAFLIQKNQENEE